MFQEDSDSEDNSTLTYSTSGSSEDEEEYRLHILGDDDPRSIGYMDVLRSHLSESTEDLVELADDIKQEITNEANQIKVMFY